MLYPGVQVVQCLAKHRAVVCQVAWAQHLADTRLVLASADTGGQIIRWDVAAGEAATAVSDGNQEVRGLAWVGAGDSHLLAVHPPNHLVLWDMAAGAKLWKKSYGDTILGLDVSRLKRDAVLLRCQHSFLVTEFSLDKCPKSEGKMFSMVSSSQRGGSVEAGAGAGQRRSGNKLRRMVRSMVLGETADSPGPAGDAAARDNDSVAAVFHPGLRGHLLIGYSREVVVVDAELGQAVGQISFDRANAGLVGLCAASSGPEPALFLLHESGAVSVWVQRAGLAVAATPLAAMTPSASVGSLASLAGAGPESVLELQHDCVTVSDHVRLAKNCRVSGLALRPATQTELAFTTTEGRVVLLRLTPPRPPPSPLPTLASLAPGLAGARLQVAGVLGALGAARCVRMCPPLTTKNLASYRPLLAVGTAAGMVQVANVSSGLVERELAVIKIKIIIMIMIGLY